MRTLWRSKGWAAAACALLLGLLIIPPALAGTNQWTPIGPRNGASVLSLAVAPSDSTVVYAGLAGGGVARSDDGGVTFRPASFGLDDPYIFTVAVDTRDADRVYAGTPSGFYRSTDGGNTWQSAQPALSLPVHALAVDPATSGALYAGTENGIYKSFDGGVRWTLLTAGLPDPFRFDIRVLAVDPLHPRRIYAAHLGYHSRMHRSLDAGANWVSLPRMVVGALAFDPAHPGTLWAATSDGILKSADNGASWSVVVNKGVYTLAIHPADPGVLYAGFYDGLKRSLDGGQTWKSGLGLTAPVLTLAADPANPGHMLAGTSGGAGVYHSEDQGATWSAGGRGLINSYVDAVTVVASSSALYVGGGDGIYRSTDLGSSWTQVLAGSSIQSLILSPANRRTMYASAPWSEVILRSANSGRTWQPVSHLRAYALAADLKDPATLYAATDAGLQKSTDAGATWALVFPGRVLDVATDPEKAGVLYILHGSDLLWTQNGGKTWGTLLTGGVPTIGAHELQRLMVVPTFPRTILAVDDRGVFGSKDGGRSWKVLAGRVFPQGLAFDPLDRDVLYVGSEIGIEQSPDGGATWRDFSRGLFGRWVNRLLFDPSDPYRLYAATSGAGLFVYEFAH